MACTNISGSLTWLSASTLEIPIRSQISSVVFEKSLHLSDVKARSVANEVHDKPPKAMEPGTEHTKERYTSEKDASMAPKLPEDTNSQIDAEIQSPETTTYSCQGSINLIAVDAPRVADFTARSYILVGISMTLIISVVVLVRLIGGLSFVIGLLVPLLFTPLNAIASRKYAESQAELMKLRDDKLATIDEVLRGIRHIKFAASESYWEAQIRRVRTSELWQQRNVFKWIIVMRFFWISSPIFLSVLSLGTYSLLNGSLSSATAFTALAIFGNIELAMSVLPFAYAQGADALVSSRRVDDFLNKKGREDKRRPGSAVKFENASISWSSPDSADFDKRFLLKNLSIEFKKEKINLICGPSGTGKSLILSAIIGEAELLQGTISIPMTSNDLFEKPTLESLTNSWIEEGQVAFVPQTPWIENASIRDNILAGLPHFESRYEATLEAAALLKDLQILEDGDMTEVGSQGINLSGGQRWRVTFARAMYSRASILILDDILSAVDAHVGRHIFFNGLAGPLGDGRTRILATHHTALCLPAADFAIAISKLGVVRRLLLPKQSSRYHDLDSDANGHGKFVDNPSEKPKPSVTPRLLHDSSTTPRAFVEDEFRARGRIQWSLYRTYIDASGGSIFWASAVTMIIISQVILLGRVWWVKVWTQRTTDSLVASEWKSPKEQHRELMFYAGIYVAISSAAAFMEAVKCAFVYLAAIRASRELFERLSRIVLRSRLRWLDVTPVGRILNRFTADFALVDSRIPGDTHTLLSALTSLAIIFLVGAVVSPYMLAVELLVLVLSLVLISKSLQGVEEIKRLEGTAKSPIFEHFRVTLLGMATIRSTGRIGKYREIMHKFIDTQSQGSWASTLATQWMALRISGLGSLFTIAVTVVVAGRHVNAAAAGLILSFSLDFSKSMDEAVRRFANLQLNMNSTERIADYLNVPHEDQEGENVPCDWPNRGHIIFRDLEARFAPGLPDTLRKINAEILPGQRIGIVGRTGAGKSTMALALFRFLEAQNGSIQIDGIDISKVRLHDLRSRMSIVAQDPVVFSGSIRTNLDPVGRHTDSQLLECLQKVHLIAATNGEKIEGTTSSAKHNLFEDLDSPVAEGGLNLSHGQRQLLSLARAILNQSKIMVMDEATSSIDAATDSLIQRAIREEFANSTLLVIAHRLSTVADFDKILVVDHGVTVEFGHPAELLERKGEFYKLVCESGERERIEYMIHKI
ncbi:ATP-dependent bile acid permease [Lachnellula suecica]|uniref:ATP-dependent bile acid permease n=1 Tax=Lachnellula suecica TaxID=602035 RepID=A0A8T9CGH9_9HELO|nr:ATP-dependent bile acid permease [Lachnellula suecica]